MQYSYRLNIQRFWDFSIWICLTFLICKMRVLGLSSSKILSISDDLWLHWLVGCDHGRSSSIRVFLAIWWEWLNSYLSQKFLGKFMSSFLCLKKYQWSTKINFFNQKSPGSTVLSKRKPHLSTYSFSVL